MRLIVSILAAMLGSTLGAAARTGVEAADRAMHGQGAPEGPVSINASITAAAFGGFVGSIFGGPRRAFWLGAVLSAAGAERFDNMILGRFGIDTDALVAKATEAASRAREMARERAGDASEADEAA